MDKDKLIEALFASLKVSDEKKAEILKSAEPVGAVKLVIEEFEKSAGAQAIELAKSNPEFTKQFYDDAENKTTGKIYGTLDNQIKSVFTDLKIEFEDERGKMPYRKVLEQIKDQLSKAPAKGNEELHAELIGLRKQVEDYKGYVPQTEIDKIRSEFVQKEQNYMVSDKLRGLVAKAGNLTISEQIALDLARVQLERNYKLGIAEDGSLKITKPDGSPVTNPQGTAALKPDEIVGSIFRENNLIKESNGDPGSGAGGNNGARITQGNNSPDAPNLTKLEQHIAELSNKV